MKASKGYALSLAKVEKDKIYSPLEALTLVKETSRAKFDETIEVHIHLGVDPRQSDQQVRGSVLLPHGTGKSMRVVVFAQGEKVKEAENAGADFVGGDELAEKIQKGWTDFDAAVSTPDMMSTVGKLGKILGPRGLMPNPKTGTVTFEVEKAINDIKAGKVEYRVDKFAIIHTVVGKASFSDQALLENYAALLDEIVRAKPAAAKGRYLKSIYLAATMGPGVKVDPTKTKLSYEEEAAAS